MQTNIEVASDLANYENLTADQKIHWRRRAFKCDK
jgi:hypothetical protein